MSSIKSPEKYISPETEKNKTKAKTLYLVGTPIGTTTDASGHYFLHDLPTGEITVEVSAVGYKTASRTITVTPDSTIELNFELEESRIAVDAVVVSANRNETSRR